MYTAYNIIGKTKFYLQKNGSWDSQNTNPKVFNENGVGFFIVNKRRVLKTKFSLLFVELLP